MNKPNSDLVILGRFGTVYGIKGWLHIHSHTEPKENILHYSAWQVSQGKEWVNVLVENSNFHGNGLIVKLSGCDDRDIAKNYVNSSIAVHRNELPLLAKSEYYWTDLIGLNVITEQGIPLGRVERLMETGANDVFVVRDTERERLIPYTEAAIKAIDLANKMITVDWDPEF